MNAALVTAEAAAHPGRGRVHGLAPGDRSRDPQGAGQRRHPGAEEAQGRVGAAVPGGPQGLQARLPEDAADPASDHRDRPADRQGDRVHPRGGQVQLRGEDPGAGDPAGAGPRAEERDPGPAGPQHRLPGPEAGGGYQPPALRRPAPAHEGGRRGRRHQHQQHLHRRPGPGPDGGLQAQPAQEPHHGRRPRSDRRHPAGLSLRAHGRYRQDQRGRGEPGAGAGAGRHPPGVRRAAHRGGTRSRSWPPRTPRAPWRRRSGHCAPRWSSPPPRVPPGSCT